MIRWEQAQKECTMKKLQICLLALLATVIWVACEEVPPEPYPPLGIDIPMKDTDDDPGDSNEGT